MNKKTVMALAAIAASGSVFAQASITGAVATGYQKNTAGARGLLVTDAKLRVSVNEDLGGGYQASATMGLETGSARGSAATRNDTSVGLMTPVGLLTLATFNTETKTPRAWVDAPISLPNDPAGDDLDLLAFHTKLGGVIVGLAYTEGGTKDVDDLSNKLDAALSGGAAGNKSLGGTGSGSGPVQITTLSTAYDNGPLSVGFDLSSYDTTLGSITDQAAAGLFRSAYKGRFDTGVSVSYDFGVAKVGAGFTNATKGWATAVKAGLTVPMGSALKFGLTYEHKNDDSTTLGDGVTAASQSTGNPATSKLAFAVPTMIAADLKGKGERTNVRVGVEYAFSKSTTLNASYGVYDQKAGARANTIYTPGTTEDFRVKLDKAF